MRKSSQAVLLVICAAGIFYAGIVFDRAFLTNSPTQTTALRPRIDTTKCIHNSFGVACLGMTAEQVRANFGNPRHVNSTTGADGEDEQWVYENQTLYLNNGRLTYFQDERSH